MKMQVANLSLVLAVLSGCSGEFIFTIPDQVAPAGGSAPVVVRVQQYEFASIRRSIEDAPLRLSIDGGEEKGAFSDVLGFAAASVPVPAIPGRYDLKVQVQDSDGDCGSATAPVWVWRKDQPIVAVDSDSLAALDAVGRAAARATLMILIDDTAIIYLTRRRPDESTAVREQLAKWGMPEGPVLVWRENYVHLARVGPMSVPKIVNEAHLVCDLKLIRKILSGLKWGISHSAAAAREFAEAGLTPIIIGAGGTEGVANMRRSTWRRLASSGLPR